LLCSLHITVEDISEVSPMCFKQDHRVDHSCYGPNGAVDMKVQGSKEKDGWMTISSFLYLTGTKICGPLYQFVMTYEMRLKIKSFSSSC
jgi:hypothetical protein